MAIDLDDQLQSYFAWIEREVGLPMHEGREDVPATASLDQPREHTGRVHVIAERKRARPRRLAYVAAASLVVGTIAGIAFVNRTHETTETVASQSAVSTTLADATADSTLPPTTPSPDIANTLFPGDTELLPASPLAGRTDPMAVWTGSRMIIWGGSAPRVPNGETPFGDGAMYDPITKAWTSLPGAPISARSNAAAVWTGTEMLIWGGSDNGTSLFDGAAFNPTTDTWRLLPTFDLAATVRPTTVWTGSEMIVLEGPNGSPRGGAFNPATNSWRAIATPPGRSTPPYPQGVWTGTELIATLDVGPFQDATIAIYNPVTDSWRELAGTPKTGQLPKLLWTGTELLEFGMTDTAGSAWNPATDSRRALEAPPRSGAVNAQPAWTGELAVFWNGGPVITIYDPQADTWSETVGGELTQQRLDGVRLWADGILLAWGGFISNPDGTASGAGDGIAWRPNGDPLQTPTTLKVTATPTQVDELIVRPFVDPAVCGFGAVSEHSSQDITYFPFALGREQPMPLQVLASPSDGASKPFAVVIRLSASNGDFGSDHTVDVNGSTVGIRMNPNGNGEAAWTLPDGTKGYLRSRDLDEDALVALIARLSPRPVDAAVPGFDLEPPSDPNGLILLHEHLNTGLSGTVTTFQCQPGDNQGGYRIQTIDGDPVFVYFGIIDAPRPYSVGSNGDGVITMWSVRPSPSLTLDQVVNADPATWVALPEIQVGG